MTVRHRWTVLENRICCEEYVKNYLISNSSLSGSEFVDQILSKIPALSSIPVQSLRMKVSNTRAIVEDLSLCSKDSYCGRALPHYSSVHRKEMEQVLKNYSLI